MLTKSYRVRYSYEKEIQENKIVEVKGTGLMISMYNSDGGRGGRLPGMHCIIVDHKTKDILDIHSQYVKITESIL